MESWLSNTKVVLFHILKNIEQIYSKDEARTVFELVIFYKPWTFFIWSFFFLKMEIFFSGQ